MPQGGVDDIATLPSHRKTMHAFGVDDDASLIPACFRFRSWSGSLPPSATGALLRSAKADAVLQLISKSGRILWVDESQRQSKGGFAGVAHIIGAAAAGAQAGAAHQPGPPTARPIKDSSEAANTVVNRLLKAIDKDRKAH